MASYIQGLGQDYLPQVQSFHPDLNFYQYALGTKQNQYLQEYNQVSGIYGSLLNSPMLRDSDIKRRDDFFKKANDQIQKITETDLSKPQNINTAMEIFKPIIDDSNIHQDIAWTRNFHNELSKAESLRSQIPAKGQTTTGYWNEGVQDLNYQAQDYSKTSDSEALGFSQAKYTPYVDAYSEAMSHIKGMGFKTSGVSFVGKGDQKYMVTTTNGTRMIVPLRDYLLGTVGSDPRVQDVYNVKARLAMRSQVDSLLPQFNGDRNAAEDYFLKQTMTQLTQQQAHTNQRLGTHHDNVDAAIKTLGSTIPSEGVKPDDPKITSLKDLLQQKSSLNNASQITSESSIDPKQLLSSTRLAQKYNLTKALAHSLMYGDMHRIAQDYSMMTAQSKMEPDKYALANFQDNLKRADLMLGYQIKSALQKEKQGISLQPGPDDHMLPATIRVDESGNFGTTNQFQNQQSTLAEYRAPFVSSIQSVNNSVYKQLANYADNSKDARAQDALNNLYSIFGKPAIDQLRSKGKLSDQNISDSQSYEPASVYNNIKTHWNDKLFRQNYNDIITSTGIQKGIADQQFDGLNSNLETNQKNNRSTLDYLYKQDIPLNEKRMISSVLDTNRNLMTKDEYIAHTKGIASPETAGKWYDKYSEKYQELFNSNPDIKPLVNPYGTTGLGTGSRTMHGVVNSTSPYNEPTQIITSLERALPNYQPYGITQEVSPNTKSKVFSPGTPEYAERMDILNQYFKDLREEMRKKPSVARTTNGTNVFTDVTSFSGDKKSLTVSVPRDWFDRFNKDYKGATGTKSPNGLNWKDFQNITIAWDKDKAPPEIFDKYKWGPADVATMQGKTVTINAFPDVGEVSMHRDSQQNLIVKADYKVIGPNGKLQDVKYDKTLPPSSSADIIYKEKLGELSQAHNINSHLVSKSPEYQDPIKSLGDALQYVEQESSQEDTNEEE